MTNKAKLPTFEVQFADVELTLRVTGNSVKVSENDYQISTPSEVLFVAPRSRILYIKKLVEDDVVSTED